MKNVGWFVGALALVLGPLMAAAPTWEWFATPLGVGSVISAIGGVLGAAFGVSKTLPTDPNVN